MPFIQIKQHKMLKIEEITQTDWDRMLAHKSKIEYNQAEAMDLVNLVRTYIFEGQPSCMSCGGTLRSAKTRMNEWIMANREKVETILKTPTTIPETPTQEATLEIKKKETSSKKKTK